MSSRRLLLASHIAAALLSCALLSACRHEATSGSDRSRRRLELQVPVVLTFSAPQSLLAHDEVGLIALSPNGQEYYLWFDASGRVSYESGLVGRSSLLAHYRPDKPTIVLLPGELPNAWGALSEEDTGQLPADLAHKIFGDLQSLKGFADVGWPCSPGYYQTVHSGIRPPSEPPLVMAIWRDHHSNAFGCDTRTEAAKADTAPLLHSLMLDR